MSVLQQSANLHRPASRDAAGQGDMLAATSLGGEGADAMELYFECITTCSLEDGECVTRCVEELRERV